MNNPSTKKTGSDPAPVKRATGDKAAARMQRPVRFSSGLALMLAAIALIGSAYLWYLLFYTHPELISTDIAGRLEQIETDGRELHERLGGQDEQLQTLRDHQDAIKGALEKIHTDLARNRAEWLLTESEQMLVIANHRLQMARDVRSALSALRAADQQLKLIVNPERAAGAQGTGARDCHARRAGKD